MPIPVSISITPRTTRAIISATPARPPPRRVRHSRAVVSSSQVSVPGVNQPRSNPTSTSRPARAGLGLRPVGTARPSRAGREQLLAHRVAALPQLPGGDLDHLRDIPLVVPVAGHVHDHIQRRGRHQRIVRR